MYRHYIQFVPKGTPPREAKEVRTVDFTSDTLDEENIISEGMKKAEEKNGMDPYAIRNHWEVFDIEANFENPPWSGFLEMCNKICSFDGAHDWKSVDERVFITVDKDREQQLINEIESYYKELNPRVDVTGVVVVDASPRIR